jgi:RNA polymerase, sigma 54 subunit, RpoN/SigL
MALNAKLVMRQGQSLVMTPQLLQAIKLLQFSNVELATFVQEELERNPLLERAEDGRNEEPHEPTTDRHDGGERDAAQGSSFNEASEGDWSGESFATDRASMESGLGTELVNSFDEDRATGPNTRESFSEAGLSSVAWSGSSSFGGDAEAPNLEAYLAAKLSLKDHLLEQLPLAVADAADRMIGHALIDSIDESGYLIDTIEDVAGRLGAAVDRVERILMAVQTLDPAGVGARTLAECLSIQLRDRDRLDPAIATLVGRLDLVAKRDIGALRRLCGVDEDDVVEMIAEIRGSTPSPAVPSGRVRSSRWCPM